MKNLRFYTQFLIFLFSSFAFLIVNAQTPDAFSYQAVVRNSSGEIVSNQSVSFRISILQNSESGSVAYSETHQTTTNKFGLANLKIGKGTPVAGVFGPGGWGLAKHFIKVEIDVNGGNNFSEMGTTQLLAVPYAFHANTVENDEVNDADSDATNELQSLNIDGNQLSISSGNTVTLPASSSSVWNSSTSKIYYNSGNVGIGTSSPQSKLAVEGDGLEDITIYSSSNQQNGIAIGGRSSGDQGIGVYGSSDYKGVEGHSNGSGGIGVKGTAALASGVNYGGHFTSNSAVHGIGVYAEGGMYGVWGKATASSGISYGGRFDADGSGGTGVIGFVQSSTGKTYGGIFESRSIEGTGVYAKGGKYDFYAGNENAINYFAGNVGIGTESPEYTLDVRSESASTTISGYNTYSHGVAVYGNAYGNSSIGVKGDAVHIGGLFRTDGSNSYGVIGEANSSVGENRGGSFSATSPEGTGVYAMGGKYDFYAATADGMSYFKGKVGIGESSPACKLHIKQAGTNFQSGIRLERPDPSTKWWSIQINHLNDLVFDYNGTDTRAWIKNEDADFYHASDRRLKENINPLESVLSKVMKLNPVTYKFKSNPATTDLSYGFVAQEVQEVFPIVVSENNGTLGLAYQSFGVLSIKALQEQQQIIEVQEEKISQLEKRLRNLEKILVTTTN